LKSRQAPRPINFRRPLEKKLRYDPQVIKWTQRLMGDRSARPDQLSEEQLAWIGLELMKTRADFTPAEGDLYLKAMADTTPILAAPRLERAKLHEDLALIWSQKEMRRLWADLEGPVGLRGPKTDYFTAKALMAVMGTAGISAHADDNFAELHAGLGGVFAALDGGPRELGSYQSALRNMPRLADTIRVISANVRMVAALADLLPGRGIGERLLIDGMGTPAWVRQVGKGKTDKQEAFRRRNNPHAGARAYMHTAGGKRDVSSGDKGEKVLSIGKFWRGYYTVVIADQVTGLPLVWTVHDASMDEARAIVPLLSLLFGLWPDCPAKTIAGDSAWDENEWCRLCEVDYGIHPIFRRHPNIAPPPVANFSRDGTVSAITAEGRLICSRHGRELDFSGAQVSGRNGLVPGKTSNESGFRVRGTCKAGCGQLGLGMKADWNLVTFYPHYSSGTGAGAQRFAMREALLTRLNQMEGIFERVQIGRKLGTDGADRTRIRDLGAHEMLLGLGFASMTAATLADQRRQLGVHVDVLDPGAVTAPLPAPTPVVKHGSATVDPLDVFKGTQVLLGV
jgi:hypothetical protein